MEKTKLGFDIEFSIDVLETVKAAEIVLKQAQPKGGAVGLNGCIFVPKGKGKGKDFGTFGFAFTNLGLHKPFFTGFTVKKGLRSAFPTGPWASPNDLCDAHIKPLAPEQWPPSQNPTSLRFKLHYGVKGSKHDSKHVCHYRLKVDIAGLSYPLDPKIYNDPED